MASSLAMQPAVKTIMDIEKSSVFRGFVQTVFFCGLYTVLGVLVYHVLLGWDIFDSLYFLVIALSTVGYGDFVPHTEREKIFTSFFLIVGFCMFGAFITMQVSAVASHTEHMAKARSLRNARNMNASKSSNFLLSRLARLSRDVFRTMSTTRSTTNLSTLGTINENDEVEEERRLGLTGQRESTTSSGGGGGGTTANMKAYLLSSYDQDLVEVRNQAYRNALIAVVIVLVGMGCMMGIESWTSTTAFYWACQTITTVGFGDVVPKSTGGRTFAMLFVLGGCGFLAKSVTDFVKYPLLLRERRHEKRLLDQFEHLTAAKLHSIFHGDLFDNVPNLRRCETELSKAEFVLLVLQLMSKVEEQDILIVASLFDKLDSDSHGVLSQAVMAQRLEEATMQDSIREERERSATLAFRSHDDRRGSVLDVLSGVLGSPPPSGVQGQGGHHHGSGDGLQVSLLDEKHGGRSDC